MIGLGLSIFQTAVRRLLSPATIALGNLSLSGTLTNGASSSGTITGATAGSTITGSLTGLTVNSSARTYSFDGTAAAGTVGTLTETLTGHSPHTTNLFPVESSAVVRSGQGFVGYYESASPQKHNPWQSFPNATSTGALFSSFPADYRALPPLSWVVPDLTHDMHDGTIAAADAWLQSNLDPYIQWCKANNSIFILTWDEDDYAIYGTSNANLIPFIVVGQGVAAGTQDTGAYFDHYSVLAYVQNCLGLPLLGNANSATPITTGNNAPAKILMCIMENHARARIIGDTTDAPYINGLLAQGKEWTGMHGVTHPSQPNYFAMFAGTTEGITDDNAHTEPSANLGSQLGVWTPPTTTPAAPTLTVVPGDGSSVVSFTDGYNGGSAVTARKLYRSTTSGFTPAAGNLIATLDASTSSFTDTGLTDGTSYYYIGTEVNAIGEGLPSNQKAGLPVAAAPPPQSSASAFTDTFTDAPGTSLEAHTSDSGHTWAHAQGSTGVATIDDSNRCYMSTAAAHISSYAAASLNQWCEADLTIVTNIVEKTKIFQRATVSGSGTNIKISGYAMALSYQATDGTRSWAFIRYNNGSEVVLGYIGSSFTPAAGDTHHIRFEVSGTSSAVLTGYVDGVEIGTYTDTSSPINVTGSVGIQEGGNVPATNTTGTHIDNLTAGTLSS